MRQLQRATQPTHIDMKHQKVFILDANEPPSSPPSQTRRKWSSNNATQQITQKVMTQKPRFLISTTKAAPVGILAACSGYKSSHSCVLPLNFQYKDAMDQGTPRPKKTFTELLPVTLTTEASAWASSWADLSEANKSGMDVPMATKVKAVTMSGRLTTQPNNSARSEMPAVMAAMPTKDTKKANHPPKNAVGGHQPNIIFQGSEMRCMIQSEIFASAWSSRLPLTKGRPFVCSTQSDHPFLSMLRPT
mmetsp:Transcript_86633/g.279763  ORF Transcript_86633/g.279763 Transcript_86633/m.279763 type:complete len:247 (+) Transcript_86633:507-1247(+)